jgi:hypothetical protein
MNEMISTDCKKVSIAAENYDRQFGIGQLHARGKRNGSSMSRMIGIQLDVSSASSRTSYAGYYRRLCQVRPC